MGRKCIKLLGKYFDDDCIIFCDGNFKQERFAGPAPRGEGQRMPSCLPVEIIDAKFNVTLIFPDRTGRAGPGGPARTYL